LAKEGRFVRTLPLLGSLGPLPERGLDGLKTGVGVKETDIRGSDKRANLIREQFWTEGEKPEAWTARRPQAVAGGRKKKKGKVSGARKLP